MRTSPLVFLVTSLGQSLMKSLMSKPPLYLENSTPLLARQIMFIDLIYINYLYKSLLNNVYRFNIY